MKMYRPLALMICLLAVFTAIYAEDVSVKVIALFTNKALLNVGGEQKILAKGEAFKGVKLISASGRGAVVSIDGVERKIGLNQTIQANYKAANRSKSRIYPDSLGMYFIDGRINGKSTRFLVDTGATYVTLSSRHAKIVGIDYRKGSRALVQTATETVPVWQVMLKSINVGDITLSNIEASVIEGSEPNMVLLGNSFLSRTELKRKGTVMELQKRF